MQLLLWTIFLTYFIYTSHSLSCWSCETKKATNEQNDFNASCLYPNENETHMDEKNCTQCFTEITSDMFSTQILSRGCLNNGSSSDSHEKCFWKKTKIGIDESYTCLCSTNLCNVYVGNLTDANETNATTSTVSSSTTLKPTLKTTLKQSSGNRFKGKCYSCKGNNQLGVKGWDRDNCFLPTEYTTGSTSCQGVKECFTNFTIVVPDNATKYIQVERGCLTSPAATMPCSNGDELNNKTCYCMANDDEKFCNDWPLTIECYSCGFSSSGNFMYMNGKNFTSNQKCLKLNEQTPKVKCSTRCMEAYHEVSGNNGNIVGMLIRDCERFINNTPVVVPKNAMYSQCSTNLCNKALPINGIILSKDDSTNVSTNAFNPIVILIFVSLSILTIKLV